MVTGRSNRFWGILVLHGPRTQGLPRFGYPSSWPWPLRLRVYTNKASRYSRNLRLYAV